MYIVYRCKNIHKPNSEIGWMEEVLHQLVEELSSYNPTICSFSYLQLPAGAGFRNHPQYEWCSHGGSSNFTGS